MRVMSRRHKMSIGPSAGSLLGERELPKPGESGRRGGRHPGLYLSFLCRATHAASGGRGWTAGWLRRIHRPGNRRMKLNAKSVGCMLPLLLARGWPFRAVMMYNMLIKKCRSCPGADSLGHSCRVFGPVSLVVHYLNLNGLFTKLFCC